MKWFNTLWEMITPVHQDAPRHAMRRGVSQHQSAPSITPMRAKYNAIVVEMKKTYSVRVRKWRKSSTGCAWEVLYANGSTARLIEAPYPKGPMSCAIFLHEIGHHAIGFRTYKPRCLEEYHAWKWALDTMRQRGFNVTEAVERRMAESLHYAVAKARRRGLRELPVELLPYVTRHKKYLPVSPRERGQG